MMLSSTKTKGRSGFTLVEILVVLVIMGFLVAMVAPKLAGITGLAIDATCDTNQKRLREVMASWTKTNSTLPARLTNMVIGSADANVTYGANSASLPSVSDGDKTNGPETIAEEFDTRWLPTLHHLVEAEAVELRDLIGAAVMNYGYTTDATVIPGSNILENFDRQPVRATLPVMMIGAGFNQAGTAVYSTGARVTITNSVVAVDEVNTTTTAAAALAPVLATGSNRSATAKTYARIAEAPMALRIMMGLSNRTELVTSGILDEAGICPGQVQNGDQFEFGNYYLILPRLQATVDRFLDTAAGLQDGAGDNNYVVAHAVNFNENDDGSFTLGARTPHNAQVSGVNLVAQGIEAVSTSCPEGHTWGAIADWFGISMARGTGVTVK